MTQKQHLYFFAELWPAICEQQKWNPNDRARRMDFLSRAAGRPLASSSGINSTIDFDRVVGEAMAILRPASLEAQLRAVNQPLKRRQFAIRGLQQLADDRYLLALIRSDRFKRSSLDELETMSDLEFGQFRFTVINRARARASKVEQPF